ncbi:MAG: hypothetical protein AAFX94_04135 [Myxococcota bacterium]
MSVNCTEDAISDQGIDEIIADLVNAGVDDLRRLERYAVDPETKALLQHLASRDAFDGGRSVGDEGLVSRLLGQGEG